MALAVARRQPKERSAALPEQQQAERLAALPRRLPITGVRRQQSAAWRIENLQLAACRIQPGLCRAGSRAARRASYHPGSSGKAYNLADLEATAAGHAAGIPRIAADEGGELTRALARVPLINHPRPARPTEATRDRFAGHAQRGAQFIRNLTGGADATTTQEGLEAAARAANKPAYAKAYAEELGGVWHEGSAAVAIAGRSSSRARCCQHRSKQSRGARF